MIKIKRMALDFLRSKALYAYILAAVMAFALCFAVLQIASPVKYSIKTSFAVTDAEAGSKSATEKLAMNDHYVWLFNEILNFDIIYENTALEIGYGLTRSQLKSMIRTESVANTSIIDIYTTASTPEMASDITRAFADNAVEYTKLTMPIDKVNILVLINPNEAVVENNNLVIATVFALIVFLAAFAIRILFLFLHNCVESPRDLHINCDIPLLGITPDGKINTEKMV